MNIKTQPKGRWQRRPPVTPTKLEFIKKKLKDLGYNIIKSNNEYEILRAMKGQTLHSIFENNAGLTRWSPGLHELIHKKDSP